MSLPAGPMISLATALEARYTLWPRDARAARGGRDRLRHRKSRQCARARRVAAQYPSPGRARSASASPSHRSSLTHLGRSAVLAHRHAQRRRATICCSPSPRRRPTGAASLRPSAVGRTAAPAIDDKIPADGLFRRRARIARLPAAAHVLFRRADSRRARKPGAGAMNFTVNGKTFSAEPAPGQCLQHIPARARLLRREEGVRRGRLRRLHGLARRHALSIAAWSPLFAAPDTRSPPSKGSRGTASCTRCSRPFSTRQAFNAASAPPA